MIEIKDKVTGKVVRLLRAVQNEGDLSLLGYAVYKVGHDFTRSRVPLHFTKVGDMAKARLMAVAQGLFKKNSGRMPTQKEIDEAAADFPRLTDLEVNYALDQDVPDATVLGVDWDKISFPEEV